MEKKNYIFGFSLELLLLNLSLRVAYKKNNKNNGLIRVNYIRKKFVKTTESFNTMNIMNTLV